MPWKEGSLTYDVQLMDNISQQADDDAGIVTGEFFGGNHEGMRGTLERYDLPRLSAAVDSSEHIARIDAAGRGGADETIRCFVTIFNDGL